MSGAVPLVLRGRREWWVTGMFRLLAAAMVAVPALIVASGVGQGGPDLAAHLVGAFVGALWVAAALWIWWQSPFNDEYLSVARDGVRLAVADRDPYARTVVALDRDRGVVLCEARGFAEPAWLAIPGLPKEPAARAAVFDRVEGALTKRARLVPDALLVADTLAAVRAELGVGATTAGPFRADGAGLSLEAAARLLDDPAASRAELLAASLVIAARGGAADRERIADLADGCADVHFRGLLRAIASGDPREEVAWRSYREQAGAVSRFVWGVLGAVATRVIGLNVLFALATFVVGHTAHAPMWPGLAVVAVVGELRRWAARRRVLTRWANLRATNTPPWTHAASLAVAVGALAAPPAWVLPAPLVPVLLYAAFWAPTALGWRRLDGASATTGVRIVDDAEATDARDEEAVAVGRKRARGG